MTKETMSKRPHVLLADDDADLLQMLKLRFERLGAAVRTAGDGISALTNIHQQTPDLICLDVGMPAGDGLSLCEMLSKEPRWAGVPVILLTGSTSRETVRRSHELCAYYVPKCADVWPRIEPLAAELLGLTHPADSTVAQPPPTKTEEPSDMQSELIDAVFSMLGAQQCLERATLLGEATAAETDDDGGQPWVLHVEDDADFSELVGRRLSAVGIRTRRAYSGMEGYRKAFLQPAEAVILDVNMPNGDGDYILRRLKETPATSDIPVIVLTGRRDRTLSRRLLQMGAVAVHHKPPNFDELIRDLRGALPLATGS